MQKKLEMGIQSGRWKGRKIPAPKSVKGHSHFTPGILKKGVFSILDSEHLNENLDKEKAVFIDLFSGSGQMGIEAVSQGFSKACLMEIDRNRFNSILETIKSFSVTEFIFCNKDAFRYYFPKEILEFSELVYFLDLPYSFWNTKEKEIRDLIEEIFNIPDKKIWIFIQSPKKIEISRFFEKNFGNHYLYFITPRN
ncbi:MAG: RsmD family RNA methyltransferase [Leptospiraceae bacterium]|nr:RsmD family RNA methyltransferase [Leptospiraceae bacterium]